MVNYVMIRKIYFLLRLAEYKLNESNKRNLLDFLASLRFLINWISKKNTKLNNLNDFEFRIFSQNGEDGILQAIFYKIGFTNKYYVEFGVGDSSECNTRFLKELGGWNGLWMDDSFKSNEIRKEKVTRDNIESLLDKYSVPKEFDLLSIDVDGNDYWIWKNIKKYNPRVVVVEYNASFPPPQSLAIKYEPMFRSVGDNYFGASLSALNKLAELKGYQLVACDSNGVNAFFVKKSLVVNMVEKHSINEIYRKPNYGIKINNQYVGYKESSSKMIKV